MISIIICSANQSDLETVSESIKATVGVPFEIISTDNSGGKRGICEVYNEGAAKAKYDILCFMHEDIEMRSKNWGSKVVEIFEENPKLGLVGIAGGGYKSVAPSSWYNADMEVNGGFYCNLIQGFKHSERPDLVDYRNPKNEKLSKVASIDGCWMCTRKSIALKHRFDEDMLKGFHGYDLDLSFSVSQEFTIAVTYEILLHHLSEGVFSESWMTDTLGVHKKWSRILPINTDGLDEKILYKNERKAFKKFFRRSIAAGYSYSRLRSIIWNSRHSRLFSLKMLFKVYLDLWRVSKEN